MKVNYIIKSLKKDIKTKVMKLKIGEGDLTIVTNGVYGALVEVSEFTDKEVIDETNNVALSLVKLVGTILLGGSLYSSNDSSLYSELESNIKGYQYKIGDTRYLFNSGILNYFKNKDTKLCIADGINGLLFIEKGKLVGFLLGTYGVGSDFKDLGIDLNVIEITESMLEVIASYIG